MLELTGSKDTLKCAGKTWLPGCKTVHHEVAEQLSLTVVNERRPTLAQAQHYHVDTRGGNEVTTLETVYHIKLKPGLHQHSIERLAWSAEEFVGGLLLHDQVGIVGRAGPRC